MNAATPTCRIAASSLVIWLVFSTVASAELARVLPAPSEISFERHIVGLLGRMGCNAGSCHGSFQGKGGLYLSLFGYAPEKDYQALVRDGMGRRINLQDPDQSLMLLKATAQVAHGGGKRFDKGSWAYQVIREWIARGAPYDPGVGQVVHVAVEPKEIVCTEPGQTHRLHLWVEFADGTRCDMSAFGDFKVQDDYVAEALPDGIVKGLRPGDTALIASYRGHVALARILVPVQVPPGFVYPRVPEHNYIDREVFAKLRKLNVVPSELASDTEFLRRVYIDTIGCLPAPDEVRAFVNDPSPDKRLRKIEELLQHPLHAAVWATRLCDMTGNDSIRLPGPVPLRGKISKMWHDWLRVRIARNEPVDRIVEGILCATSREGLSPEQWVEQMRGIYEALNKGFDTPYADRKTLDLFWLRNNLTQEQIAEQIAAAFLGIRMECAQCHKHPFDRWKQADYRAFVNVFGQVRTGVSPEAREAIQRENKRLQEANKGKNNNQIPQMREVFVEERNPRILTDPESGVPLRPRPPGGPELVGSGDYRQAFVAWLRAPDNPYFARNFVNRVWAHYFGVGLVEPVDNFSVANPPSNERLLHLLADDFVRHGYDLRHLERTILQSRTYQLSSRPNPTNVHDHNNYARSYLRRPMAEAMVDVLNSALGVTEPFGPDVPAGIHAVELAPSRVQNANLAYIFRIFGRPTRSSTCDCERSAHPALPQTLFLMTDPNLLNKITSGRLRQLLSSQLSDEQIIEELFLATLTRFPTPEEKRWALEHVRAHANAPSAGTEQPSGKQRPADARQVAQRSDPRKRSTAFADVLWALINTREFVLNH